MIIANIDSKKLKEAFMNAMSHFNDNERAMAWDSFLDGLLS
jgi:hypothetical protein